MDKRCSDFSEITHAPLVALSAAQAPRSLPEATERQDQIQDQSRRRDDGVQPSEFKAPERQIRSPQRGDGNQPSATKLALPKFVERQAETRRRDDFDEISQSESQAQGPEPPQVRWNQRQPRKADRPPNKICVDVRRVLSRSNPNFISGLTSRESLLQTDQIQGPMLKKSSSHSDLEKFQQLQQVFPDVSMDRAKRLLAKGSIRTAMNVLAEESFEVKHDSLTPSRSITTFSIPEEQEKNDYRHPAYLDPSKDRFPSAKDSLGSPSDCSVDNKSANLFTTMAEFEKDVGGEKDVARLEQVLSVFPLADEARSMYLLRQNSISTVLMMFASETCD